MFGVLKAPSSSINISKRIVLQKLFGENFGFEYVKYRLPDRQASGSRQQSVQVTDLLLEIISPWLQ